MKNKIQKTNFAEWSEQFCAVHKSNGRIGLLYFISTLFRSTIYEDLRFFPHIFFFGAHGTGKSEMNRSIASMFNEPPSLFSLQEIRPITLTKLGAEYHHPLLFLNEYTNSIDINIIRALILSYDGDSHHVVYTNNIVKRILVNYSSIISGQCLPIEEIALYKRVILLHFHQTEFTEHEIKERMKLIGMEKAGLSHIEEYVKYFHPIIKDNFISTVKSTVNEFNQLLGDKFELRIIYNMAILVTMQRLLSRVLEFPFTDEEFTATTIENIRSQNNLIQ